MQNIYESYLNTLRNVVEKKRISKSAQFSNFSGAQVGSTLAKANTRLADNLIKDPTQTLHAIARWAGVSSMGSDKLGEHPDFAQLKITRGKEYHYVTSVFIDIKNSTRLHQWYDLEDIYTITDTIQKAAIHTCRVFGGHIQRLQGDGTFAYFGGKNVTKKASVQNALTATSIFTYFVKNDIKKLFEMEGIDDIHTRIGIDFGDDDKVMWAVFGTDTCYELTTNSLHTSLASKLQQNAGQNGIMVGKNVTTLLPELANLFAIKDLGQRYIYQIPEQGIYYSQHTFEWQKYLSTLPYIKLDNDGNLCTHNSCLSLSEQDRLKKLDEMASDILVQKKGLDITGNLSSVDKSVKVPTNNFYYDPLQNA